MKDSELKVNLIVAFQEKLKEQINNHGYISLGNENIAILNVIKVQAFLINDLNIYELLSEEGTNLKFSGYIDFTIKVENGTMDKKNNHFSLISVNGKYKKDKNEFVFDKIITINLDN